MSTESIPANPYIVTLKEFTPLVKTHDKMLRVRITSVKNNIPRLDIRWFQQNGEGYLIGISLTVPQMMKLQSIFTEAIAFINDEIEKKEKSK